MSDTKHFVKKMYSHVSVGFIRFLRKLCVVIALMLGVLAVPTAITVAYAQQQPPAVHQPEHPTPSQQNTPPSPNPQTPPSATDFDDEDSSSSLISRAESFVRGFFSQHRSIILGLVGFFFICLLGFAIILDL